MLRKLTPEEIASLLEHHPEQSKFDCKRTLNLGSEHEKSEFVKDVVGVANAHGDETGYLLYGVDLGVSDAIIGMTNRFDDASLQQLVNSKVDKPVSFIYHEANVAGSIVGVVVIPPSSTRPHVVRVNFGSLREGDIKIRRGSTTTWATSDDLREMFSGEASLHERRSSAGELIQRVADPNLSTSSLALEAWQVASSMEKPEDIEWLRKEIVGYERGKGTPPSYRGCRAYASVYAINPFALAYHTLDSIAAAEPDKFKKTELRVGTSLAELEDMLHTASGSQAIFHASRKLKTSRGRMDGYVYFTYGDVRSILTSIRNRIIRFLMNLQMQA